MSVSESSSSVAPPQDSTNVREELTQFALNSSILSGMFEDVNILAFSRRSPSGKVSGARRLYANSALLRKELSHSALLLAGEWQPDDSDLEALRLRGYEYPEDSDLEDGAESDSDSEEDSKDNRRHSRSTFSARESADADDEDVETPPQSPPPTTEECANTSVPSDSEASLAQPNSESDKSTDTSEDFVSVSVSPSDSTITLSQVQEHKPEVKNEPEDGAVPPASPAGELHEGAERTEYLRPKTILSLDVAFRTWRTFIFRAYTGKVVFAPLRSQGLPYEVNDTDPMQLPVCSPKSMYRLAVKYGNEELKTLAAGDIRAKLTPENILDELFSLFTSRFPEIQDMEIEYLLPHFNHQHVASQLPQHIDRFGRGELPERSSTFAKLMGKLVTAANTSPAPQHTLDTRFMPQGPTACPKGCWKTTIHIQYRCTSCQHIID